MRTRSQRLLSMVLALSMLLTFLPVSAFADYTPPPYESLLTLENNNTYTNDVLGEGTYTYTLNDDGTATLTKFTGTNADVPETVTKDRKPYTVTAIGDSAFINHGISSPLTSVNLPNSIQTIGHAAFHGCSSLSKITLPERLTTVGNLAFWGANLDTIDWPESLTIVGESAFQNKADVTPGPDQSTSTIKPISIIIYHGTKAQWDEMASAQHFATTNPQLVAPGVDLRCAHTVTFNANGHGTDPDNQVVDKQVVQYNDTAIKPRKDPTADGFTFKGWYTEPEGGEAFDFTAEITEDKTAYAQWEKETTPDKPTTPQQPGTTTPTTPPESTDKPTDKPNEPNPPQKPNDTDKPGTQEKPNEPTTPSQKPEQTTPPDAPAVEEDDTAAIGYAAAAVTAAFVGWGAYRIGSEVYLKYLLPKDVLLPQNRIQLAELLWEDAGRPAPADAAPYADVDANDTDARQAARWAVENGLLTLPNAEKPEEFAPYRSVSYAKSARAWNKAQQLKENAAAR